MSETVNLNAYFKRIDFAGSIAPTLATLEALTALHPAAIPFENLNPLLGLPVALDQKSLEKKLLSERRGGYCFEHNLLFMRVLADLDYTVRPLPARVLWGTPEGTEPPVSHMLLAVEISGAAYIADVGFGGVTPTAPLRLRDGVEQETPHETFRLGDTEGDWQLDIKLGEEWRPVYRFTTTTFEPADYEAMNTSFATDPESSFRHRLIAAIAPKGARHTLRGNRLTTHSLENGTSSVDLVDLDELKETLSDTFGINLPHAENLDSVLSGFLPAPTPET